MTCGRELGGSHLTEPGASVRRSPRRKAAVVVATVLAVASLALLAAYAARRVIAREIITGWLRDQGVAAQVEVSGLGLGGATGRLRVGDPKAPDLVIGDATVAYRLRGLNFEVGEITVKQPVVRARLHGTTLSLGSLDRLIDALRKRPPRPDQAQPRVQVEQGLVLLATDYGPLRLVADATVEAGRLTALKASTAAARLRGPSFDLTLGRGTAGLATREGRTTLTLDVPIDRLQARGLAAQGARLEVMAAAPYPDLTRRRMDGALALRMQMSGAQLAAGPDRLDGVRAVATFEGQVAGALDDVTLSGRAIADARGVGGLAAGVRLGAWRANAQAGDLRWTRKGGEALSATLQAALDARALAAGDLRVASLAARAKGPVAFGANGLRGSLLGELAGEGAWRGLGPAGASDAPPLAAIKRAAQAFTLSAPALRVDLDGRRSKVVLREPVRVRAAGGGLLTIAGRGAAPLVGPDGGALRLTVRGGGLPSLDAEVRRLGLADGGVTAQGSAKASGDFGPAENTAIQLSGVLAVNGGAVRFEADRCAPVSVARLELGANDLERLSGRFCPAGGPLFTLAAGDWRLRGKATDVAAEVPFLQARLAQGDGQVVAGQEAGKLGVTATLAHATVADTAAKTRFEPVQMAAAARLTGERWTAELTAATPAGQALGRASLRHDMGDGRGGLAFDTGDLVFAEGGLQPARLSPLASALASPVNGRVQFTGSLDWTPAGATSRGTLTVDGLDFQSAAGRVSGLRGVVAFDSLAPLNAAPGQKLSAQSVAAVVPITDLTAVFGLDDKALSVTGGQGSVGGGQVRIESLHAPLSPDSVMTGVLTLDGVQLHDLVEASPFGDRVELDARVSGRVPFQVPDGKVRIADAEVHAIQPGRLSISRQALTGVAAAGSVAAPGGPAAAVPPTDTFTDFAYQAMENLAFETLNAAIASRPDGRLGILAHVTGRNDPPQHQEIRLSIFDLIGRKFLGKPLPLPSGTGVDLTLDMTLNLDDLLADYADYRRLHGSPAVQPAGPKDGTKPTETPR